MKNFGYDIEEFIKSVAIEATKAVREEDVITFDVSPSNFSNPETREFVLKVIYEIRAISPKYRKYVKVVA